MRGTGAAEWYGLGAGTFMNARTGAQCGDTAQDSLQSEHPQPREVVEASKRSCTSSGRKVGGEMVRSLRRQSSRHEDNWLSTKEMMEGRALMKSSMLLQRSERGFVVRVHWKCILIAMEMHLSEQPVKVGAARRRWSGFRTGDVSM